MSVSIVGSTCVALNTRGVAGVAPFFAAPGDGIVAVPKGVSGERIVSATSTLGTADALRAAGACGAAGAACGARAASTAGCAVTPGAGCGARVASAAGCAAAPKRARRRPGEPNGTPGCAGTLLPRLAAGLEAEPKGLCATAGLLAPAGPQKSAREAATVEPKRAAGLPRVPNAPATSAAGAGKADGALGTAPLRGCCAELLACGSPLAALLTRGGCGWVSNAAVFVSRWAFCAVAGACDRADPPPKACAAS